MIGDVVVKLCWALTLCGCLGGLFFLFMAGFAPLGDPQIGASLLALGAAVIPATLALACERLHGAAR